MTDSISTDSASEFDGCDGLVPLEYVVVETDDDRRECTIFPRDCDDHEILTHWVTAIGDSFVCLEDTR